MKNFQDEYIKRAMTKIVVYKSHKLKNDFISVTYAIKEFGYISTLRKKEVKNLGGAKYSIAIFLVYGENYY
jgi:hypothetical protein